ncbi:aminotransferase class V-fold PLP-dependent enzyme [Oceanicaulis sp. MMSF_3324]|uniref:aminotransferase class V-fold PLP-dependent enzyme n=1 Tax=Oceanicaulis sp. MMSF_3324 TaxID=3046702 RepID=UPI00273DA20F|nr:aminotransferase class V-fold PLP-dependent enzyme [Oceanicaulis sp. MMSF_3324]
MTQAPHSDCIAETRSALMGGDGVLRTPFGLKPLVYADYAASGRGDRRIETELERFQAMYANPHTDDSATGREATGWLHRAEAMIKQALNAGEDDVVLACGSGATGAVSHLQQILGVYEAPATRARLSEDLEAVLGEAEAVRVREEMRARTQVVFIGPYEHHSNELTWRESRAEIVRIGLDEAGGIDLVELEQALSDPAYRARRKIGAFSAASNVTGVRTDVPRLARLLHAHDAILCLDCAASAPYLRMDMNPAEGPESAPDALYFSPHKFIGGPGACGILAFKSALYRTDLPPTLPGGGTVTYVTPDSHDFIGDITARERAGTPGVMQMMRAAFALKALATIGYEEIEAREQAALDRAFERWRACDGIEILGPQDPERRIGIVSFNIRAGAQGILHPRFVATLLNDVFGVQARAGCSCAGPYAHHLLGLDDATTGAHRDAVLSGYAGMRPGWCRLSLHWVMDEAEIDYLIEAVLFVAEQGPKLLPLYDFNAATGAWRMRRQTQAMGLAAHTGGRALMAAALEDARLLAETLNPEPCCGRLPEAVEGLRRFPVPA